MNYPQITGIMAADPNGLIGAGDGLPWDCPEDREFFRSKVSGQIIIAGRKTYESLPKDRLNGSFFVVFSKKPRPKNENTIFVSSLAEFFNLKDLPKNKKYYMVGGALTASLFLENNLIGEFILTKIKKTYEGDVFLPLSFFSGKAFDIIAEKGDFSILLYKLTQITDR